MAETSLTETPNEANPVSKPTQRVMLVTGQSGAGKSTALKTLEDLGWEAIDNFPIRLLPRLLETPLPTAADDGQRPLAIGFDTRTRGFDPVSTIARINALSRQDRYELSLLFLDCSGRELERRYAETRRRHPLAQDRPAIQGIAEERELLQPLRQVADHLIDTTPMSASDLQQEIRQRFTLEQSPTSIIISSFGFARGMPQGADLVFDMRFLRNPHWDNRLRPMTGLDAEVAAYISADPSLEPGLAKIVDLLLFLLPQYQAGAKGYVNIAIGCTGGRHRSVFVAEEISKRLQDAGFCPSVIHRNLNAPTAETFGGKDRADSDKADSNEVMPQDQDI